MKKLEHLGEKCRQKESTRRGSSAGAGQGAQQEVTPEIVLRYGLSIFNDDDEKDILTNKEKQSIIMRPQCRVKAKDN